MLKHDLEDPDHLVLFVFRNEERMVLCGLLKLFHCHKMTGMSVNIRSPFHMHILYL